MYVVYKIVNTNNSKFYFGGTGNYRVRQANHKSSLKYNRHSNKLMQRDYNLGHSFEFIVLHEFENKADAFEKELSLIGEFINTDLCYNIDIGGDHITYHPDKDELLTERRNRTRSPEHNAKLAAILRARNKLPRDEAMRLKWSKAARGRKMPPKSAETLKRMSLAQLGKKLSPETVRKMSLSRTGRKCTAETKEKMRASNPRRKMVSIDGVVYNAYSDAARALSLSVDVVRYRVLSTSLRFSNWVLL